MTIQTSNAFAAVEKLYQDYGVRARELSVREKDNRLSLCINPCGNYLGRRFCADAC